MKDYFQALDALADRHNGELTPEIVVEAARDPGSPLHSYFDWNNDTAAHKFRLEQGRRLIRVHRYEITYENMVLRTPVYVRNPDKSGNEQGYISIGRLRTDEDMARDALYAEFKRVRAHLKRAMTLAAILNCATSVQEVLNMVDHVERNVPLQ